MADSKITKKRHPSASLSRRILLITIFLLVIPLFLQSLFLYWQEYRQRLEDTQEQLEVLAKERVHFLEELIQKNWILLDMSFDTLNTLGTPNSNVKRLYTEQIPLPQGVGDRFVLASKRRSAILVGKKESSLSALIIAIPFAEVAKELGTVDTVRLALTDDQGTVILETAPLSEESELLEVSEPIPQTHLDLQLTLPTDLIHGPHLRNYLFRFASLVFFVGVLGGGAVYLLTRRIAKPLKSLCKTMERVSEGATHVRYEPDWMGFEINDLGLQFNETLDGLLHHTQEAAKERFGREKLAEELRIGHEIQASLLPQHIPGLAGIDLATRYFASKEVNGDFYDLFQLANGHLLIAVCDTAGKGISACLYSLGLRSMLRSIASMTQDIEEIVRRINDLYSLDAHASSMFSTLWLGIYDPSKHHLIYCSQGHPPALLRHGQKIEELWTNGIALGAQSIDTVPTKEITLRKGDLLLLYTDGILEAHDPDQQLFGKKRLRDFVLHKKQGSSEQIADQLIEEVRKFSQGAPQHDDMTLVVMQIS